MELRAKIEAAPIGRKDMFHAADAALVAWGLYILTCARTVHVGDSPELATVAATFGVAHPPGYALYTILAALWTALLSSFIEPAHATNLLSGLCAAVGVGLAWLLPRRLGLSRAACWFTAGALALGRTYWSQAVVAEVYAMDVMLLLAVANAGVSLVSKGRQARWASGLLWGLLLGSWLLHRPSNLLYTPALALLMAGVWTAWPRRRVMLLAGVGLALAAAPLIYLPLASARDPYMDMGDPETWEGFLAVVSAAPFRGLLGEVPARVMTSRAMLLATGLPVEVGLAALAALPGVAALWARGKMARGMVGAAAALILASGAFTLSYDILDYEAYLIPLYLGLCLLGGGAIHWLGGMAGQRVAWALALTAAAGLALNYQRNDLGEQDLVEQVARDVLGSVSPNALLLTQGDASSTAMAYLQAVKGESPGVRVVRIGNLAPWSLRQLAARYPEDPWPKPGAVKGEGMALARPVMKALLNAGRPVFVPLSVDPSRILPRDGSLGLVPRGLVKEVRRRGERIPLRTLARGDALRLQAAARRITPLPAGVDMDLRSMQLGYALALANTGEVLARFGDAAEAEACFAAALALKPGEHEAAMAEEVGRKGGQRIPRVNIEARVRAVRQRMASGASR